jgi:hypothetical protein
MNRPTVVMGFVFALAAGGAGAEPIRWTDGPGANGHYYEYFSTPKLSWRLAKDYAETLSHNGWPGHLVTITSIHEQVFVEQQIATQGFAPASIGLTDNEDYGGYESEHQPNPRVDGWVWVTGEPVVFTAWQEGEPSNTLNEDYVRMATHGGEWNDNSNWDTDFIVEYELVPEPSAFGLLAATTAGLLLCGMRRRKRAAPGNRA